MVALRRTLARWLHAMATWIDVPPPPDAFQQDVRDSVKQADEKFGRGFGEAKRRHVFALTMKAHPKRTKREISRAIEDAVAVCAR